MVPFSRNRGAASWNLLIFNIFYVFEVLHKILSIEFADSLQAVSPNNDEDGCQFSEKLMEPFSRNCGTASWNLQILKIFHSVRGATQNAVDRIR